MKKAETDQKYEETDYNIWGNRLTNWDFWSFWKKAETDQKYEGTNLKFEETDQQYVIFKVFEKSGNR